MLPKILIGDSDQGTARAHVVLPPSGSGPAEDVFGDALLDKNMPRRKPVDWLVSFVLHVVVVAMLVVVPMLFTHTIDLTKYETTYLTAPPPPMAPPPPPPAAAAAPRQPPMRKPSINVAKLTMPIAIPKNVVVPTASEAPAAVPDLSAGVIGGVPGGVAGGVPGGSPGGILGGMGAAPPPPAPPAAPSNQVLHVGGDIKPPHLIARVPPVYPVLAREARIEGDVKIDAVIDKNGNVVQAKAVDGAPLLIGAALDAVRKWKYQPTFLNGTPYPVELTVDVSFHLAA